MYVISVQAKEDYKNTSPASWKKCKGSELTLEQKICEKAGQGNVVSKNNDFMVVRYYFLNFLIDLHRNEIVQISEVKYQRPVYVSKSKKSIFERMKLKIVRTLSNMYRIVKRSFLSLPKHDYMAYFDGSCLSRRLGVGFHITTLDGEITVYKHSEIIKRIKVMDNADAELIALIRLLEKVKELGIKHILINGDCKGLIDSINNNTEVTPRLQRYIETIRSLMTTGEIKLNYVSRKYNRAHNLSRQFHPRGEWQVFDRESVNNGA